VSKHAVKRSQKEKGIRCPRVVGTIKAFLEAKAVVDMDKNGKNRLKIVRLPKKHLLRRAGAGI